MLKTTRRAAALAFAIGLAAAACASPPSPSPAPPEPDVPTLPSAAEIIDRYVDAIGGREAVLAQPGSHATGTFSMPAVGLQAPLEVYAARDPDRTVTTVEISGLGKIQEGYTGEYGWAVDPNLGPRILEGKELAAIRERASAMGQLRDASMFTERTTLEETEMNGQACYRVKLVWNSGRETFDCYSVETGLLVATENTQATPMGDIPVVSLVGGYESFGGVLTPTEVTQQMMGQEQRITVDTVQIREIDPERFTPPPAIRTLIEQQEEGG